ncbi:unnamed protein product [Heterobilharzia americana]|nr:unnamed protein product [Heterobilharzia americana]
MSSAFVNWILDSSNHCYDNSSTVFDCATIQAFLLIEAKAYAAAVHKYNQLIEEYPFCPQLYTGRAAALMKRNWNGDVYNALLDCRNAMQLTTQCHTDSSDSPSLQYKSYVNLHGSFNSSVHLTALLLSVRCLLSLDWLSAARIQLKQALDIFPNLLKNTASQSYPKRHSVLLQLPPLLVKALHLNQMC